MLLLSLDPTRRRVEMVGAERWRRRAAVGPVVAWVDGPGGVALADAAAAVAAVIVGHLFMLLPEKRGWHIMMMMMMSRRIHYHAAAAVRPELRIFASHTPSGDERCNGRCTEQQPVAAGGVKMCVNLTDLLG